MYFEYHVIFAVKSFMSFLHTAELFHAILEETLVQDMKYVLYSCCSTYHSFSQAFLRRAGTKIVGHTEYCSQNFCVVYIS